MSLKVSQHNIKTCILNTHTTVPNFAIIVLELYSSIYLAKELFAYLKINLYLAQYTLWRVSSWAKPNQCQGWGENPLAHAVWLKRPICAFSGPIAFVCIVMSVTIILGFSLGLTSGNAFPLPLHTRTPRVYPKHYGWTKHNNDTSPKRCVHLRLVWSFPW